MTSPDPDAVRILLTEETDRARREMPPLDTFIRAASARRRRRRGAALGATLVVALAIFTVAWVGLVIRPGPETVDAVSEPTSLQTASPEALTPSQRLRPDQVADLIAEHLRSAGRDGGGTWDADNDILHLYVAGPTDGKSAALEEARTLADDLTRGTDFQVELHPSGVRTEAELVATMDAVSCTLNYAPDGSVTIRAQRIDHEAGQVEVQVTTPAAARLVEDTFGDVVRTRVMPDWTQEEIDEMFGN